MFKNIIKAIIVGLILTIASATIIIEPKIAFWYIAFILGLIL